MSYEATMTSMNMPMGTGTQIGSQTASTAGLSGGGGGYGAAAGGVLSGVTSIANAWINASAVKNTAKFNSTMSDLQGRVVRLSANEQIKDIRKKAQSLFSTQQAMYAKAGVSLTGSPAAVMLNSLKEAELDEIYTNINADLGLGAIDTQKAKYDMVSQQSQTNAINDTTSTLLNMSNKYINRG